MESIPPIVARRKIEGISAVLLPFLDDQGTIDWESLESSIGRTLDAGLAPAVNMDTGFGNLIGDDVRQKVLETTSRICDGKFFAAGAFVGDNEGDSFAKDRYGAGIEAIQKLGGVPIIFQSFGLTQQGDSEVIESYKWVGSQCDRFIGFELGKMFAPFGSIYSLDVVRGIMEVPSCIGIKHSSLNRELEWDRLRLRNEVRPDFKIYTGNDLAIDMVMYGSDYLLGLSAFSPQLFATRDQYWLDGNPKFYQLNDILQYLGAFGFRDPVPAYKHSCAMFLKLQGMLKEDFTHPRSTGRPDSDREVLEGILRSSRDFMS